MNRGPYRITSARRQGGRWRGVLAVLALFVTAADALATALIGIPPVAWIIHQVAAVIRATYRRAAYRPSVSESGVVAGRVIPSLEREWENTDV